MPISLPMFDKDLERYFAEVPHDSVLDIGPGEGKFGKMLQRVQPSTRRIAIELDSSYVEQYGLREIYDDLRVMNASRLIDDVMASYGAVIIGDVIEHLPKSAGIDLLNFLTYRSSIIFVKFPVQMRQNDWKGHLSEAHVSIWSEHDFLGFDHVFVERDPMQMAVIRGYRNNRIEWLPQSFMQTLGYKNCEAYYDEQPGRWRRADRYSRWQRASDASLRSLIKDDEKFIMIDEEQSGLLPDFSDRRVPFLEREGAYFGMPADDDAALAEVRRQHAAGAKWVVITQDSFWAFDVYPRFCEELRSRYRCALENDGLVVFELDAGKR